MSILSSNTAISKTVFLSETVMPLSASSPLKRTTVIKRSGKVDGVNVVRESMVVDLPATIFSPSAELALPPEWVAYAYASAIEELVKAELSDYDRLAQVPDSVHSLFSNSYTSHESIYGKLAEYAKAASAARTRSGNASRIVKADVERYMRTDEVKAIYLDAVAVKQEWTAPYSEGQKLQFESYYSKNVIPTVQVLCSNTATPDQIAKALKAIELMDADSEVVQALAVRADMLLNAKKDTSEFDLGLFE